MEKTIEIIIQELREQIATEIESIDLNNGSSLNALGMKMIATEIARGGIK